ncbi:mitochondrial ribosomal death-associated protein 3-domain-containing protein [Scleroderma citrinum]
MTVIQMFVPMQANQLTHPLFESEQRDRRLQLQNFHPEILTEAVVSQGLAFSHNDKDPFRIFGLPRNLLVEYRILSKPCSVVRGVTIDVINRLDSANQEGSANHRLVFSGAPGCGKSVLLLQALQYCHARDWIVLYFPRTVNLVNSTTSYTYDPRTATYLQPVFAFQTLQRFLTVNEARLEQLRMQSDVELERRAMITAGTTLAELVKVGIREQALAPTILTAVLGELDKQTAFPVLLAIDDFQAMYCKTKYRHPHFARIQPYHLSMPRLLLEYAGGLKTFARGAVLGALSGTDTTFKLPLELAEALDLPTPPDSGPYAKRSRELQAYSKGLSRMDVPEALTVSEAAELFDIWSRDTALPAVPNDELFLAKYSESSGNARDFVWKGLLSTLTR